MKLIVNGEPHEMRDGTTLVALLESMGLSAKARGIAVARNGEVVLRAAWPRTRLQPDDRVEVLHAVQGG